MGKECVVVGCSNRDTDKKKKLKFHRIPKYAARRSKWLKAINRKDPVTGKDWEPGDDGARVCSDHFIVGKSDDPKSPDYVPTLNLGYATPLKSKSLDRFNRVNERNTKRKLEEEYQTNAVQCATALLDLANSKPYFDEKENIDEQKSSTSAHDTCIKLLADASLNTKLLERELERLQLENHDLKQAKPKLRATHLSEEEIVFYSGLPSASCFVWLVNYIEDSLPKSSILSPSDMLLLTLMKLRLNVPNKDIALRFGLSETSVTTFIDGSIPEVAKKLKFLIRWPEKDDILRTRPQCFKDTFPRCVSIIDCTEVYIECPSNFCARSATYSSYKHANTIKFLVSITPAGSVSFVSLAHGGSTSDKLITLQSGYLDHISHGDLILADRGFLISDELAARGAELVIPAFTRGKPQLSAREVENGRKISNVRIHVERAMERLKNFRILAEKNAFEYGATCRQYHNNLCCCNESPSMSCSLIVDL